MYFYRALSVFILLFLLFLIYDKYFEDSEEIVKERIYEENDKRAEQNRDSKLSTDFEVIYEKTKEVDKKIPLESKKEIVKTKEDKKREALTKLKEQIQEYHIVDTKSSSSSVNIYSQNLIEQSPNMMPIIPTLVEVNVDGKTQFVAVPTEMLKDSNNIAIEFVDENGEAKNIHIINSNSVNSNSGLPPQIPSF
jgi:hypothetical protein